MDERISALVLEAERELARRKMGDFVLYVDHNYRMNWHDVMYRGWITPKNITS